MVEIIVALIGLAGVLGVPLGRWWWKRRQDNEVRQAYEDRVAVGAELARLREVTGAIRTFVLKSENGGGIPTPGRVVSTSVLYESCRPGAVPVASSWVNVRNDHFMDHIINDLLKEGVVHVNTAEAPLGDFRTAAEALGTQQIYMRHVSLQPDKVLFMSVTWDEPHPITPRDLNEIRVSAGRLALLLHS